MLKHINNSYSQNSFHEDTEEKDSLESFTGLNQMWAFVLYYKK